MTEAYVRSFHIVSTRDGRTIGGIEFDEEIDALAYLAYTDRPREWHVEVARPPLSADEERARSFAIEYHGNQKYGEHPYVVHLEAVRQVLCDFCISGDLLVAAWLHDVLEDTKATREEVRREFGERVERLVWAVSGFGQNRRERKTDAFGKMDALTGRDGEDVVDLKLGDRIGNVEAGVRNRNLGLFEMYKREMVEFRDALSPRGRRRGRSRMWSRLHCATMIPVH